MTAGLICDLSTQNLLPQIAFIYSVFFLDITLHSLAASGRRDAASTFESTGVASAEVQWQTWVAAG